MTAEQVDIQAHLCLRRIRQVFQEISRESSSRDLVIRPFYDIRHTVTTGADHRETLVVRETGNVFLDGNDHDRRSLLYEILMSPGEGVGVHHDDARGAVAPQIAAIIFQATAVLHQDGFRGFSEQAESQALEEGTVFRFGEDFHVGEAPLGGLGNQPGNQGDGEAEGTGPGRDGEAFDDVPPEAAAGEDGAFPGEDRQIQINFPEPETVAPEEVFHLAADRWNAQRQFLYVDRFKWFHHPAGFPILPAPPQIDLT